MTKDRTVEYALQYLGTPYVKGEFDCSRFIQAVFRERCGILRFPRYLDGQWLWSHPIDLAQAKAGDLIFFCAKALWKRDFGYRWYSHAGIATGQFSNSRELENCPNPVIHCSFWEKRVVIWPLEKFYERYFLTGVRRALAAPAEDFEGIETYGGRELWAEYHRRRDERRNKEESQ